MNQNEFDDMALILIGTLGDLNRAIITMGNAQNTIQKTLDKVLDDRIKDYTPEQKAMYDMLLENKDGV